MKLDQLRIEINEVDWQLLQLLKKRLDIAKNIAQVKKELNLPIFDAKREGFVIKSVQLSGKQLGLDEIFLRKIWKILFAESKRIQRFIK